MEDRKEKLLGAIIKEYTKICDRPFNFDDFTLNYSAIYRPNCKIGTACVGACNNYMKYFNYALYFVKYMVKHYNKNMISCKIFYHAMVGINTKTKTNGRNNKIYKLYASLGFLIYENRYTFHDKYQIVIKQLIL